MFSSSRKFVYVMNVLCSLPLFGNTQRSLGNCVCWKQVIKWNYSVPTYRLRAPQSPNLNYSQEAPVPVTCLATYQPLHPPLNSRTTCSQNENPSWLETTKVSLLPSSAFPISRASQPGLQNHNGAQTRTPTRGHRVSNLTCQHEHLLATPHQLMTLAYGVKSPKLRVVEGIKTIQPDKTELPQMKI